MGQYLAIGIVTRVIVSKKELKKGDISQAELIDQMQSRLHFNTEIFSLSENEDYLIFMLKDDVFHHQLIPFLEKLYPIIYNKSNYYDYKETLDKLKSTEPSSFLALAKEKSYEEFQIDPYGEDDYLYFEKSFKPNVSLSYDSIMLSSEGKIAMEMYGRQFNFFKYCITQTFHEFSLANALRVYITG